MVDHKMTRLCAGIAVVSPDNHIVIVKTHKGWCSLPKGKLEKGEEILTGALRELEEETGIKSHQIELIEEVQFIENSEGNKPSIIYFAARCKSKPDVAPLDPEELAVAQWIPLVDLTKQQIYDKRKPPFEAIQAYFAKQSQLTP